VANRIPVLILQHPAEICQAKGTVRLLGLSLRQCRVEVGEVFEPERLGLEWLAHAALLYPDASPEHGAPSLADSTASPSGLVVLDGTWRDSRRMLRLNPWLRHLPRLALVPTGPSRYRIRRATRPDHLSTLEATCQALARLEGREHAYAPLLAAIDGWVAGLARRMGPRRVIAQDEPLPIPPHCVEPGPVCPSS
jgi:DTW domain-containing protein YfiP